MKRLEISLIIDPIDTTLLFFNECGHNASLSQKKIKLNETWLFTRTFNIRNIDVLCQFSIAQHSLFNLYPNSTGTNFLNNSF